MDRGDLFARKEFKDCFVYPHPELLYEVEYQICSLIAVGMHEPDVWVNPGKQEGAFHFVV